MNNQHKTERSSMHLRILLPTQVLVDEEVNKVIAQAENGDFCLLPRHIDFVSALTPGVLYFRDPSGKESYAAVDEGILVKCEQNVYISTLNAVRGEKISELQALVEEHFLELDEHERKTRTALARLEAGTLRGFRELQERLNG